MPVYIHHIATRTPRWSCAQDEIRDRLKGWAENPAVRRLIHAVHNRSGIRTRHSVTGGFSAESEATFYRSDAEGRIIPPGTAERNLAYTRGAREMAVDLARCTLAGVPGLDPAEITHVIYASCTGFANPGPDFHIIRELGLRPDVQRFTLGFMGCYAAFPALRMASQFCGADPSAVVLVVCLELCTLHMQINDRPDCILANSLFSDGAAAAVVSGRTPPERKPVFRLDGFESALMPSGEPEMAWEIGDEGFNIVLSSYVPDIIGENIRSLLEAILLRQSTGIGEIDLWAVHPGGRSILDKVERSLSLEPHALDASRAVLRDFGNMSSATILFVLRHLLEKTGRRGTTCAMAFGPGLTMETARLELLR